MDDYIKIREVTARYNISARTLRYYEDVGLIQSARSSDYAYRLYDQEAIHRLEQILILRRLNISIKDIQRIFGTSSSETVLEVLSKKVQDIETEVSLLQELKEIVLTFIRQIEQADFSKEADVRLLYEKARDIRAQIANVGYSGNPGAVNRLLEVTEKLDRKVPDIMIVKIPPFRAVTSGRLSFEELFGGGFGPWQEAHNHLFRPVLFDAPDFLCGTGDKAEWFWAVKDDVTQADTAPWEIVQCPGGLYAAAVSIDGDGESHDHVRRKTEKWLEDTGFVMDDSRKLMGHMVYVDEEIKEGLGYDGAVCACEIKAGSLPGINWPPPKAGPPIAPSPSMDVRPLPYHFTASLPTVPSGTLPQAPPAPQRTCAGPRRLPRSPSAGYGGWCGNGPGAQSSPLPPRRTPP